VTQQHLVTTPANSGRGDSSKSAFDKCENNFNDLYGSAGSGGAASIIYNPPFAGSIPETVAAKLAQTVSVLDFAGVDPTNTTDSTAGLQAAINAAINSVNATAGGSTEVQVPAGNYRIGTGGVGLVINSSNVTLVGAGGTYIEFGGTAQKAATTLTWAGGSAPTAAMIDVISPAGALLNGISSVGVSRMFLQANNGAGFGLRVTSVKSSQFSQLYVLNPITAAYLTTTLQQGQLQVVDTQHNIFTQCYYRCFDSVAAKKAHGFWFTSFGPQTTPQGNSSFNMLINCVGLTDGTTSNSSGIGYLLDDADNNRVMNCINYRANGTTAASMLFRGYKASCDGNIIDHFSDTTITNAIVIQGNATLGTGYNPTQNVFFSADSNNGIAFPTMDAGCRCFWHDTNGAMQLPVALGMVIGQASQESAALGQVANVGTRSLVLMNANSAHAVLTDNTNIWGLNIDGSGNFRLTHPAGAGTFSLNGPGGSTAQFTSATGSALSAGGNVACGTLVSSTANLGVFFGTGPPTLSAAEGSIYSNTTGAAGARLYVNTSAGSGTTWTALTTP
jgi:hypothetical protein